MFAYVPKKDARLKRPRSAASDLSLHCLPMFHKKDGVIQTSTHVLSENGSVYIHRGTSIKGYGEFVELMRTLASAFAAHPLTSDILTRLR